MSSKVANVVKAIINHPQNHHKWVVSTIKQDEAHEPECSHVCYWYRCQNTWLCSHAQYLSAIVCLNSLVHVSLVTSLQCGVESVECGVWSVK